MESNQQLSRTALNMQVNESDDSVRVPLALENWLDYDPSKTTSPDELIIKQRGRRSLTLHWSPEKAAPIEYPFQKTPTKYLASQRILRSSPRKRLALRIEGNFSPSSSTKSQHSPRKTSKTQENWSSTPVARKKLRLDEISISAQTDEIPLQILLKGLNKDQLIGIINNLVKSDDKLEKEIRSNLPIPDIRPMEEELMRIKRNIFKSLSESRLWTKTESTAYARAATHLITFRKTIVNHTKTLHDSTHWEALLDYVTMAWNYVRATPLWENNSHNSVRQQCFKILSCHCVSAVKNGGNSLGEKRLQTLDANLNDWSKDCEDTLLCAKSLNETIIKYRASL